MTACGDNAARVWNIASGQQVCQPLRHKGNVRSVAFSPAGSIVLTGSDDSTARFWDVSTSQPIGPAIKHRAGVLSVAFTSDGRKAITASHDGTATAWDVPTPLLRPERELSESVRLLTLKVLDDSGGIRSLVTPKSLQIPRDEEVVRKSLGIPSAAIDRDRYYQLGYTLANSRGLSKAALWHLYQKWLDEENQIANQVVIMRRARLKARLGDLPEALKGYFIANQTTKLKHWYQHELASAKARGDGKLTTFYTNLISRWKKKGSR